MTNKQLTLLGIVLTVLGIIVAAFITGGFGLWSAHISRMPPEKKADLKLVDVTSHVWKNKDGSEVICILDVDLKNSGNDSCVLKAIEVKLGNVKQFHPPGKPDRCTECHGERGEKADEIEFYVIGVKKLIEDRTLTINPGYAVPPAEPGRILLKLGGQSLYAKVVVSVFTDEEKELRSDPVPIMTADHRSLFGRKEEKSVFDGIRFRQNLVLEMFDEKKMDEMIRSGYIEIPVWDDKKIEQKR